MRPSRIESALNSDALEAFVGRLQSAMEATEAKKCQKKVKNGFEIDQIPVSGQTVGHRPLKYLNGLCGMKKALKCCIVHLCGPSGSQSIA